MLSANRLSNSGPPVVEYCERIVTEYLSGKLPEADWKKGFALEPRLVQSTGKIDFALFGSKEAIIN